MAAEVVEKGGGSGECRAGMRTGRLRAVGKAAWMGSSKKAGFNQFTETTSVLDPSWRRKYLYFLSEQDKVPSTKEPKREEMKLHEQTQILLPSRQAEVVEVENCAHDVAEEQRIQQ